MFRKKEKKFRVRFFLVFLLGLLIGLVFRTQVHFPEKKCGEGIQEGFKLTRCEIVMDEELNPWFQCRFYPYKKRVEIYWDLEDNEIASLIKFLRNKQGG